MSRFCPGQNCGAEDTDSTTQRFPPSPSCFLYPSPGPVCLASGLQQKTTLGAYTCRALGYLGAHLGQVGFWPMTDQCRGMKGQLSWLRCGLTLRYNWHWRAPMWDPAEAGTWPESIPLPHSLASPPPWPAPPVPGKTFNKSFAHKSSSLGLLPRILEILKWPEVFTANENPGLYSGSLGKWHCQYPGESHLWARILDANWFPPF